MKDIKVTIKPKHFRNADEYHSDKCPLALALEEMGYEIRHIGRNKVGLNGTFCSHKIPYEWGNGDSSSYDGDLIDNIIDRAKVSLKGIPTVELLLTSNIPD